VKVLDAVDWEKITEIMKKNEKIRIIPKRPELPISIVSDKKTVFGLNTEIVMKDPLPVYMRHLKKEYNFELIKKYIQNYGIFFTLDCMNTKIGDLFLPILSEIGADDSCLLNKAYTVGTSILIFLLFYTCIIYFYMHIHICTNYSFILIYTLHIHVDFGWKTPSPNPNHLILIP
jgi:hypothetical protein